MTVGVPEGTTRPFLPGTQVPGVDQALQWTPFTDEAGKLL